MEETKSIEEMRHEVIENTIRLENIFDEIISDSLGFELEGGYDDEIPENADNMIFRKHFLQKLNLPQKYSLVKDITEIQMKEKLSNHFGKDFLKFIQIRNKFAHTLSPPKRDIPGMIGISIKDDERINKQIKDWIAMYLEHTKLYEKFHKELREMFFIKIVSNGEDIYFSNRGV